MAEKAAVESSCAGCSGLDTVQMVQCDDCDKWYHYTCVLVDESVAGRDWSCEKCKVNNTIVAAQSQSDEGQTSRAAGTVAGQPYEAVTGRNKPDQQRSQSVMSTSSRGKSKMKLELARLEEQRQLDQQYLEKKYTLLALADSSDEEDLPRTLAKVDTKESADVSAASVRVLSSGQLSARQALSKELPAFSGRPEEWAVFISNYTNSTQLCGFSNAENLVRLQRALKGKALEVAGHNLLLPETVPEAISTLKMLFGRPDLIIGSLLRKIRAEAPPKAERFETIINFSISVRQIILTMQAAGLREHLRNPMLLQELVDKLPPSLRLNWAMAGNGTSTRTLEEFSLWLHNMAEAASTLTLLPAIEGRSEKRVGHLHAHQEANKLQQSQAKVTKGGCFVCQRDHRLFDCDGFKQLSVADRWKVVKNHSICENCLRHSSRMRCGVKVGCCTNGCEQRHHSLLHHQQSPTTSAQAFNAHQWQDEDVLFRIAPVTIHANGKSVDTYAFLDSGSSLTLLEQDIADSLELRGVDRPLCLKWTADVVRVEEKSQLVSIEVSPRQEFTDTSKRYIVQDIRTVEKLSLPRQSFDANIAQQKFKHLRDLPLETYLNVQPKLLIGIPNEYLGVALKIREGNQHQPIAMETRLGWVVSGGNGSKGEHRMHHHFAVCECEQTLHDEVRDFFALDNIGTVKEVVESTEEKRALQILEQTTKRIGDRYESGLLWKYDDITMPNSYPMALKRLECIERKTLADTELRLKLDQQIDNLLEKGYARKLDQNELQKFFPRTWYLPIFIARNPNKPEKVRLVWDGAAKTKGISLNTLLLKGPDQLVALPSVLYSFRTGQVAICGDISEMFHQVRVSNNDQHSQRFLWRDAGSSGSPDVYAMEVLTFGATCSPSVAQYVRNVNANRFSKEFPRAVVAITRNHYVDDLMDSVSNEEEAIQLARDVEFIHSKGGFRIRGWLSNSIRVMRALGEEPESEKQISPGNTADAGTTNKVLGLWWRLDSDAFTFSLRFIKIHQQILEGERAPTKRELLKVLMSVFDPLGFLAHYLVILKVILQEVWRSAVDWDESIPDRLRYQWNEWLRVLPQVEDVRIPRCYSGMALADDVCVELHVFVDASEHVMAAVAYFRISVGLSVECAFVGAKTKVAPRRPMSIPRMELQAATIGVRLAESIEKGHSLKIQRRVFWTDSRTVLSWLKVDPKRYNQFVMYRISEVLECSKLGEWRWIPSKENVADDATKWKKMPTFSSTERWFQGPSFLYDQVDQWPGDPATFEAEPMEELRPKFLNTHLQAEESFVQLNRFSTWKRLRRTMAWIIRVADNFKKAWRGEELTYSTLSSEELKQSQEFLIKMVQQETYSDEMKALRRNKRVSKSSTIYKLSPYVDENGLIRMRGRIDNAECVELVTKRPLLMPRQHPMTKLLIQHYHALHYHGSHETVLNKIKQQFWIPGLRMELRAIRQRCAHCQQNRARPRYPEMAPLPAARLAAFSRPFTHVGVDYFGPMVVTVGRRSEKRWGVLFTCLTVRAIHLELAHSLSTDSCIMCIRNFIGRRGTPAAFYSDNGTNFTGAHKELQEALKSLDMVKIEDQFTTPDTKWVFNPPASPHMGGSWKRLVGSVKTILKEVTHNQRLQDDSLLSMFIEVEAIINSRPLTHVSLEAEDAEALTPNHFLLGCPDGSKLPGVFDDSDLHLHKSWRRSQQLANFFWKRWVREYLPTLTKRTKWFEPVQPIKTGDIVVIVDENSPRGSWPKGVVVKEYKAPDGQVRRAAIKTSTGIYVRPVVKLAVLHIKDPSGQDEESI